MPKQATPAEQVNESVAHVFLGFAAAKVSEKVDASIWVFVNSCCSVLARVVVAPRRRIEVFVIEGDDGLHLISPWVFVELLLLL